MKAQRGSRTSSRKPPHTAQPAKNLVWVYILHSLASLQKFCPRRHTHFLTKQPNCCTCLMRLFLEGCTSDGQRTVSTNTNKCLITSLLTQAHISLYYCASLLCEWRGDMLPPHDDVRFPKVMLFLYNPVKKTFQMTKNMLIWL